MPKSMTDILGRPFLAHQIDLFKKNKIFDIVLCTGYLSEQIEEYFKNGKKFGVNIKYSHETEPLDTGGALKNAESLLDDEFFIIYGDSYLLIDYQAVYRYFKKFKKLGLMTIYKTYGKLEPANIAIKKNLIQIFDKKNPNQISMVYTEYGLNIFKKTVINSVDKKAFPIGEYFKNLIAKNELLNFESPKRYYEIGRPESLKETADFIKTLKLGKR